MVFRYGLEPSTSRLSVVRSNQLSYGNMWQGWLDSNQRVQGSEPCALPLGYIPIWCLRVGSGHRRRRASTCRSYQLSYRGILESVCCYAKGILAIYVLPRPCDCTCVGSNASQCNLFNRLIAALPLTDQPKLRFLPNWLSLSVLAVTRRNLPSSHAEYHSLLR